MSDAKNIIEEHENLKAENDSMNELLEEANAKITEVSDQLSELSGKVEKLESANAELSKELEKEQGTNEDLNQKVEALTQEDQALEKKVSETLNEIGVEPVSLQSEQEEFDALKSWGEISDPIEKTNFYRQHKEKILGGLK
jgi:chromosome segregation ATPase